MRILAGLNQMKTNQKFDFYAKLLNFFKNEDASTPHAIELVEIYNSAEGQITLQDVTLDNLIQWHEEVDRENLHDDPGITFLETVAECFFEDLAPQMRSEAVQDLLYKWREMAGITEDTDVFVHIRNVKMLGDKVATVTLVVNDIERFRELLKDPDREWYTHVSEKE